MAKQFNIYIETDDDQGDYLGTYHAKTFLEAVRAALKENDMDPQFFNKKTNEYDGYKIYED